ncbi:MAG TPA: alkaline phosphatase family protein [bacterium]|nr:alkaline phosphatase family protein [bacterium]
MRKIVAISLFLLALLAAAPAHAYVGPGAGFAFITSFFFLIATFFVALFSLAIWPLRFIYVWLKSRRALRHAKVKRVVVLGLDGMDPQLAERWMADGHLPTFKKLAEDGGFHRLRTTFPSVSPVAWSSFMTGANPGRHNIYDFLSRDTRNYMPTLSSAYIGDAQRKIKLGKYTIPLSKPEIRLLRKSKPFWVVLGEHGIFSTVLRVPITFPPEKFNGVSLSGMCVPDIRGSQGTFSFYTTKEWTDEVEEGGVILPLQKNGAGYAGELLGPPDALVESAPEMKIPFMLLDGKNGTRTLKLPDREIALEEGKFTEWVRLSFQASLRIKVNGIARFLLTRYAGEPALYVSPINLDPEKPAFPISHPAAYSMYLSKLNGPYANLGLAEDTWVLNEGLISDELFLEETYLINDEREKMFNDALAKTKSGLVVCVFDGTDRIQHMFFRYLVDDHPSLRGKERSPIGETAVLDLYKKMDALLARTLKKLKKNDVLFVMSDHGFKPFNRGINLNSWLRKNGYLALKDESKTGKWLSNVDWSKTRAYQVGLGGLYLNIKGRERHGIVEPGEEAAALRRELIDKLSGLRDEEKNETAINRVWDAEELYTGPYKGNAPDLIVGYNIGYRAGWDGTTGVVNDTVIDDNVKAWSGDHCVDPRLASGVLFTSFKLDNDDPSIMDIAPTVLYLLGVQKPGYMDGASLLQEKKEGKEAAS